LFLLISVKDEERFHSPFITEFIVILCLLTTYKLADYFFGTKGFTDYSLARRVIAMLQPVFLVGMHITSFPGRLLFYSTESKQKSSEIFLSAVIILFAVTILLSFVMLVFKKAICCHPVRQFLLHKIYFPTDCYDGRYDHSTRLCMAITAA
jgi:hypothetical protein